MPYDNIIAARGKPGIYKIENLVNGKVYIGSSGCCIRGRVSQHRSQLRGNRHSNKHLQASFSKRGEENFDFDVVEIVDDIDHLLEREQYWLDKYWETGCYNMTRDAARQSGFKHTKEAKEKMSKAGKARWNNSDYRNRMTKILIEANRDPKQNTRRSTAMVKERSQEYQGIELLDPDGNIVILMGSIIRFAKKHGLNYSTFHSLLNRTSRNCKDWTLKDHSLPCFISPTGERHERVYNVAKFARNRGMMFRSDAKALQSVSKGKQKAYKGWTLAQPGIMEV